MSFWAPIQLISRLIGKGYEYLPLAHPFFRLYPGDAPAGGETLLASAWFQMIICLGPDWHLEESSPQYTGGLAVPTVFVDVAPVTVHL